MGNQSSQPVSGASNPYTPAEPEYHRHQGNMLAQERNACFAKSKECYRRGDHSGAKHWSSEGRSKDVESKKAHSQAAQMYFERNNKGGPDDEVDLHGLKVSEAVEVAKNMLETYKAHGRKKVVFVVGRGLHSQDHVPKIKPAIMSLVNQHNLRCYPGVPNAGCITVEFVSASERGIFGWVWSKIQCVIC